MIEHNINKALALSIMMSTSAMANINNLSPETSAQLDIEQMPGVYFESDTLRENPVNPAQRNFSLQIQQPDSLPLTSGDRFFEKQQYTVSINQLKATISSTPAERSGCPALALNSAVYTNFTAEGQFQCYSVELTTATKIEGLLVNIPSDVDYNLYFFKLEDDNSFTTLDFSNYPTATTEKTIQKVDPGIYILAAQATQGLSPEPAIMGWFDYPDFDQQESNDKVSQATLLTSTAIIQGNIDNANDLDYFTYQTGSDQTKIKLKFSASAQFSLELWTGSAWAKINNDLMTNVNVTPNSSITFLARGVADNMPSVSAQYALTVTDPSAAMTLTSTRVWNNENLTNLLHASYLEAHQYIGMSGKVTDDNGQPVPFATVILTASNLDEEIGREIITSNINGDFNSQVALPDCIGTGLVNKKNRTYHGAPTNPELWWDIWYELAHYQFSLYDGNRNKVSETGREFLHICKEKITKSCYWQRDYQNGGEVYKCNHY